MKDLNLNTVDGLTKLMNEMNNVFNNKIKAAELNEAINNIDNISFIECRQLFESISDRLYDLKAGSKVIAKYIKIIKESKELQRLYICSDILKGNYYTQNPSLLVNETTSLMNKINRKKLNEDLSKLKKVLKEGLKEINVTVEEINSAINENKEINHDITFILCENKKPSNIVDYTNAMNNVVTFVSENVKEITESTENVGINDVEKIMDNDLELWENAAIEKIVISNLSGGDKKNIFEDYKSRCMNLISELLEDEDSQTITKSQLFSMKEGLEKKEYHGETANDDILKLAQLEHTLQD